MNGWTENMTADRSSQISDLSGALTLFVHVILENDIAVLLA
jgi:hypothetical protein